MVTERAPDGADEILLTVSIDSHHVVHVFAAGMPNQIVIGSSSNWGHCPQCPVSRLKSHQYSPGCCFSSLKIVLKSDATFDLKGVISSFKSVSFQSGISFQSGLLNVYFSKGPIFGRGGAYWTQTFLLKLGGAIASSKLSKMQVYSEKEQWLEPRSPLAPIANCYSPSLHLPLLSPNERINIL